MNAHTPGADALLARLHAEMARQEEAAAARAAAPPPVSGYVRSPHPLCAGTRCQAPALTSAAEQASTMAAELFARFEQQERERLMTMTPETSARPCAALWCEEGGHSFSERDPGMKVVVIEGTDDAGARVSESRTMCGGCAPKVNVRRTRPEISGYVPGPDGHPAPVPAAYTAPAVPGWTPSDDGAPRL